MMFCVFYVKFCDALKCNNLIVEEPAELAGFCPKLDFFQNLFSFLSARDSVARNALFRYNKKSTSTKFKRRLVVAAYAARGGFAAKKIVQARADNTASSKMINVIDWSTLSSNLFSFLLYP